MRLSKSEPPNGWHPAIQALVSAVDKAATDAERLSEWEVAHPNRRHPDRDRLEVYGWWETFCNEGKLLFGTHQKAAFRVSVDHYRRALRLINSLANRATRKGYTVTLEEHFARIRFSRDDITVPVRISEKLDRQVEPRLGRWSGKIEPTKVAFPTGRLGIYIESSGLSAKIIDDRPDAFLEKRMAAVLEAIERSHIASVARDNEIKELREQWRIEAQLREKRLKLEAEEQKRVEAERVRRADLISEASAWIESRHLRSYLSALDRRIASGGTPAANYKEWRAWAGRVAEDHDLSDTRVRTPPSGHVIWPELADSSSSKST